MDPKLHTFLEQFQHLKIPLEEITSATNNFDNQKNCIGRGGFGRVYKGELSHHEGRSVVAIKRLESRNGQGAPEFLKELTMLSRYNHENLISLRGFCCEEGEMILVYELASRGSLDCHLNSPDLTWRQRLKICIDAAKGLSYLHDPRETHQRLIHCDVKSANILLDDQWNAKVSDFGLSTMGSANEQNSVIVTVAAGTPGYLDPQYARTHTLTKESDVYSFGVVLFEVLCGTLCCTYNNGRLQQNFVPTWIKRYEEKKLNEIIFKDPSIQQLDQSAIEIVADIAYRCLKESREHRPKMTEVVTELESALESQELLESQEFSEWKAQLFYYQEIVMSAEPPLNYRSEVELLKLLYKGVILNHSNAKLFLNKTGEHREVIAIEGCLCSGFNNPQLPRHVSRFPVGPLSFWSGSGVLKMRVKAQFLSPGITYTVNLGFKFPVKGMYRDKNIIEMELKYKLQGETETSVSHLAYYTENEYWRCELYQFTIYQRTVDLQIIFYSCYHRIEVAGFDFLPLEKVDEKKPISDLDSDSDSDSDWEEKLPTDYDDIMKLSTYNMRLTKKEVYSVIHKGLFISDRKNRYIWFFLDKNGKKCHMLSASAAITWESRRVSLPESRFGEAVMPEFERVFIKTEIQSKLLSDGTAYAVYLVYMILPEYQSRFEPPVKVHNRNHDYEDLTWYIFLVSPQTPVIRYTAYENTHNPLNRPKIEGIPQQRNEDWMEVQIWELRSDRSSTINMDLMLTYYGNNFKGLIIEGIEFRPI